MVGEEKYYNLQAHIHFTIVCRIVSLCFSIYHYSDVIMSAMTFPFQWREFTVKDTFAEICVAIIIL